MGIKLSLDVETPLSDDDRDLLARQQLAAIDGELPRPSRTRSSQRISFVSG